MDINDSIIALEEALKKVKEGKIDCLSVIALGESDEDTYVVVLQTREGIPKSKIFQFLGNIYKMANVLSMLMDCMDYNEPKKGLKAEH